MKIQQHKSASKKIWRKVKLSDVLLTSSGGTPSTTKKEYWDDGEIPWLNSGALKDSVVTGPTSHITALGLRNSSAKIFPKNTVLIALTGSTLGRVGLLNFSCSTNQSVIGIYPSKLVNSKYIFYYFLNIKPQLISKATGSAQPHINKNTIDETLIPIIPIEHQKEAVLVIEKILRQISDIKDKASQISLLEDQAFNGYINNGENLFPLVPIGNYCSHRNERIGKDWEDKRLIGVSNSSGIVDLRVGRRKTFENYKKVYPGDFVYNPMRINIGSIAIYEDSDLALTSPDYVVFSITSSVSKLFLLKFLKSGLGLDQINNNTKGSVRSRLYYSSLEKINIPFCGNGCQSQAELVLGNFAKMKQQIDGLMNQLKIVFDKTLEQCFTEGAFRDIKFTQDATSLIELMKKEKTKNISSFNKLNTQMRKRKPVQESLSLVDVIKKNFGKKRFLFDSLQSISNLQYDILRDQIFEMMDTHVVLEFDTNEQQMYLKLK